MARPRGASTAEVVAGAARVFEAKGYANTTIDDICLEVGISRPTIYKRIESKPWLLDEMVALVTEELGIQLEELHGDARPAREKIQSLIQLHVESANNKRIYYATVFREQPELSAHSKEAFRRWSHKVTHDFALLIDEYRNDEKIADHVDAAVLANLTLTMLTSLFRWYNPEGATSPGDLSEQILLMLSGPLPGINIRETPAE